MAETPDLLCKYTPLGTPLQLSRLRNSLIRKQIYFPAPIQFNDPYDCAPAVAVSDIKPISKRIAKRMANRRHAKESRRARVSDRRRIEQALNSTNFSKDQLLDLARSTLKEIRETVGVLSLTTNIDNILMWGHYANCHKGCVLLFDTRIPSLFQEAQKVEYSTNRPILDFANRSPDDMANTLLHKAEDWRYEDEWRVVRTGQPGSHPFPPEVLTGIIFGAQMRAEDRQSIRQAASIGGILPTYAEAVLDEQRFEMKIRPL